MKRPLCHLAILLTAVVYLYLELFSAKFYYEIPEEQNGEYCKVVGKVWDKTFKQGFDGSMLPVIHIIPQKLSKRSFELVECYLDGGEMVPGIGEYVEVCGRRKVFEGPSNPGEFDSRLYYSTLKISYRMTGVEILGRGGKKNSYREGLFEIRMYLEKALDEVLDTRDASVMKAMLLGDKAYMDDEIKDMYKSSGIMHILAVSGLHISIIGMGLYRLLKYLLDRLLGQSGGHLFSRGMSMLPAFISIAFMYSYGVMCGMGTSSFRAIMMFVLRLLAPLLGRTYDILSALALAEILLILDQPLYLYNSGFLFSFGAIVGITVINPCLELFYPKTKEDKLKFADDRIPWYMTLLNKLKDGIRSGVSIALATLPVYASFYYTYPIQSIFLNLLVIPVMGVLMLLGIAAMLLGAAFMPLASWLSQGSLTGNGGSTIFSPGEIPGFFAHLILSFYEWLCSFDSVTRLLTWYMGHSAKWQIISYVVLISSFVALSLVLQSGGIRQKNVHSASDRMRKTQNYAGLNLLHFDMIRLFLVVTAVLALTFHIHPDLEINMVDVGQGDGIVISCGGKNLLIDGGSTSKKKVGKYQIIPFLKYKGIGTLDAVVMTHEDEDHTSGIIELLDDMEKGGILIRSMILPEISQDSRGDNYRLIESKASSLNIPILYINSGETFTLAKAKFTCLNPKKGMTSEGANEYSTVLYMEYPHKSGTSPISTRSHQSSSDSFTALFTGDVEGNGQQYLTEELEKMKRSTSSISSTNSLNVTLLKVAHHGSKYTTDEAFLELITPKIATISCGRDNSYGHPHQEVLERLSDIGAVIYRTDLGGCINIVINDDKITCTQFR